VTNRRIRNDAVQLEDDLQIRAVDEQHAVATRGNMILIVWRGETRLSAIANAKRILLDTLGRGYDSYGLMQLVEAGAPPPNGAARNALAHMLAAGRGSITCSSLIFPGNGFFAAAARSFATGLTLLARPGFPHVVFPTVQEAAEWHTQLLSGVPTSTDICMTVNHMHAALDRVVVR
jgi:hypothetical protein